MALGSIWQGNRLGIANSTMPFQTQYGYYVFDIWYTLPIYQQHLVRGNVKDFHGCTKASADWNCAVPDSEDTNPQTLREISAVDTQFARRNLNQGNQTFFNHRAAHWNQIYYLNNEPDIGNVISTGDPLCNCWNPNDRGIDPQYAGSFQPNANKPAFWEPRADALDIQFPSGCPSGIANTGRRIKASVLAWLFLRLKRETDAMGHGHIILPPSTTDPDMGIASGRSAYWYDFFKAVHKDGVSIDGQYEPPIAPANLRALNIHGYSWTNWSQTPLQKVKEDAMLLKSGANWYKNRLVEWGKLNPQDQLPVNIVLSEFGPLWGDFPVYDSQGHLLYTIPGKNDSRVKWRGIWPGFRKALSWWNSWLCWLTRNGPIVCNLQGWETGTNTIYPLIHEPSQQPFTARNESSAPVRNQSYLSFAQNPDRLYLDNWPNTPNIAVPIPGNDPGYQGYLDSFSMLWNYTSWQDATWAKTPLGACYTAWARVGPDDVTQNINTGWASNTQSGVVATATIYLPAGPTYATVYFPVIKGDLSVYGDTQFTFSWSRGNTTNLSFGKMMLLDIDDTMSDGQGGLIYSAMVYPVVVYNSSTSGQQITVQISRNVAGPTVWLGRPVTLKGGCSWFASQ